MFVNGFACKAREMASEGLELVGRKGYATLVRTLGS